MMDGIISRNGSGLPGEKRAFARRKPPSSKSKRKLSQSDSGNSSPSTLENQEMLSSYRETKSLYCQTATYKVLLQANNSFLRDNKF